MSTEYTTVQVTYELTDGTPSRVYTFKAPLSLNLRPKDFVVVPQRPFTICRVVYVHDMPKLDPNATYEYKWIVDKVDLTLYTQLINAEEV